MLTCVCHFTLSTASRSQTFSSVLLKCFGYHNFVFLYQFCIHLTISTKTCLEKGSKVAWQQKYLLSPDSLDLRFEWWMGNTSPLKLTSEFHTRTVAHTQHRTDENIHSAYENYEYDWICTKCLKQLGENWLGSLQSFNP